MQRLRGHAHGLGGADTTPRLPVPRRLGWTWKPTGELFGDWWARQDVKGRNVWLRSIGVRLTFDRERFT